MPYFNVGFALYKRDTVTFSARHFCGALSFARIKQELTPPPRTAALAVNSGDFVLGATLLSPNPSFSDDDQVEMESNA
jgi:hypothetical protein